jgi:hypothetical protein
MKWTKAKYETPPKTGWYVCKYLQKAKQRIFLYDKGDDIWKNENLEIVGKPEEIDWLNEKGATYEDALKEVLQIMRTLAMPSHEIKMLIKVLKQLKR